MCLMNDTSIKATKHMNIMPCLENSVHTRICVRKSRSHLPEHKIGIFVLEKKDKWHGKHKSDLPENHRAHFQNINI